MSLIMGKTLALLAAALVLAGAPVAVAAGTTTTYDWSSLAGFTNVGSPCSTISGGKLTMTCQSAALQSVQAWDHRQNLTIEGTMSAQPAPGSSATRYWGGLVLLEKDDGPGATYLSLVSERNIAPISMKTSAPKIAALTIPEHAAGFPVMNGAPGQSYPFKIAYSAGSKLARYYVNNMSSAIAIQNHTFRGPVRAWTICVSVNAGEPNDGSSALCQFGPVKVTGQKL